MGELIPVEPVHPPRDYIVNAKNEPPSPLIQDLLCQVRIKATGETVYVKFTDLVLDAEERLEAGR